MLNSKVLLCLFAALSLFFAHPLVHARELNQSVPTQVVLQIYFYDDVAFDRKDQDLFENMFMKLRPDLVYKRISIKSNRWGGNKKAISRELKERIKSILAPNEELSYLLIDTHGSTQKSNTDSKVTSLNYIGKIYENGVDPDFSETFFPLKDRASEHLQIILNSCSSFCGGKESASQRGKSILSYFRAEHGGIYGSDTAEIAQSLDHRDFVKWKYLMPSLRSFLTLSVTASIIILPWATATAYVLKNISSNSSFEAMTTFLLDASLVSGIIGTGTGALMASLKPLLQFISSRFFLNRGYYFAFENGELKVGKKVIKRKEIKNLISNASSVSCQSLF